MWPLKGLDDAEAKKRLSESGPNELETAKSKSLLRLFLSQFKDILIIVLIIAAAISGALHYVAPEQSEDTPQVTYQLQDLCIFYDWRSAGAPACQLEDKPLITCSTDYETLEACAVDNGYPISDKQDPGVGLPTEAILIFVIVVAIALVGFLNEYKAEKTVEALKKLVSQKAKVRRGGEIKEIPAREVVSGDIILLEEGMRVPADLRLVEVRALKINESSLTGESDPVSKHTELIKGDAALGDQVNMAFSSTIVTVGTAEGVVVATGEDTQIGQIADLVNNIEDNDTPMQRKLDALGKQLGMGVLAICAVVFVAVLLFDGHLSGSTLQRVILAFTAAVALAVAAIPEGLAFVVRISLALGARRMAAKNALVRKLSAVEALGSTDIVCSDKTGTLTKGEMTVRQIFANGTIYELSGSGYDTKGDFLIDGKTVSAKPLERMLLVGALCNNAHLNGGKLLGDPTEGALVVSAAKAGIEQKLDHRLDEVPFSSERKRMSTVYPDSGGYMVATKGALENVLDVCTHVFYGGKRIKLSAAHKQSFIAAQQDMARSALRVLAFATKATKSKPEGEKNIESGLTLLGLQGMMDPPRKEVVEVIHRVTTEAGMRVVMITGDHIETAKAVAKEIGLQGEALSGVDLDRLSQSEFERKVESISVYARVNPEHKIRIVQALQKHGHQVAMTGDGVNDAPAIKAADIGVAMGVTGTDATKEAADLILLDDQFLTIISAIEEGRGIFDNVRKFVNYLLSANIAEVITILFGVLIFQDLVLTAVHLLFINIVTDGLPAVALGSDPAEKGVMRFKPHHFQGSILNKRIWVEMLVFGTLMSVALLAQYQWDVHSGSTPVAAAFAAMIVYEMVRLVDIRTDYRIRWFSNPWLSVAIAGSISLMLAVLYVPALSTLFEVGPVSGQNWLIIAGGSIGLFTIMKLLNPLLDRWMPEIRSS